MVPPSSQDEALSRYSVSGDFFTWPQGRQGSPDGGSLLTETQPKDFVRANVDVKTKRGLPREVVRRLPETT